METGDDTTFIVYLGSTEEDGNRYISVDVSILVYTISSDGADNMIKVE